MRWRIPLVVVIALFVAVSCDQQPIEPANDTTTEINFAQKTDVQNEFRPWSLNLTNPCNADEVYLEGTDHRILIFWDNDHWRFKSDWNLEGTAASGVKYKLVDSVGGGGWGPFPETWGTRQTVVSTTSVDNFLMRSRWTVNANGDVTVDHWAEKCVG